MGAPCCIISLQLPVCPFPPRKAWGTEVSENLSLDSETTTFLLCDRLSEERQVKSFVVTTFAFNNNSTPVFLILPTLAVSTAVCAPGATKYCELDTGYW